MKQIDYLIMTTSTTDLMRKFDANIARKVIFEAEFALKERKPQKLEWLLMQYFGFHRLTEDIREDPCFARYMDQLAAAREEKRLGLMYFSQERQDLTDYMAPYSTVIRMPLDEMNGLMRSRFKRGFIRRTSPSDNGDVLIAAYGIMKSTFIYKPRDVNHHFFFIAKLPYEQQEHLVDMLVQQAKKSPGNPAKVWNHWFRSHNSGTAALSTIFNSSFGLNGFCSLVDYAGGNHDTVKAVSLLK
jgi:hypothetical protein